MTTVKQEQTVKSNASERVAAWMQRVETYPHATRRVELIETHISWVFLTDRYVYKLKKPVCFDFLDFSTIELRRQACEQELHLNRRLALDVYLDVVPVIARGRGRLQLGGEGRVVDWVVKMRRLPADAALDELILRHATPDAKIDQLACVLCDFYRCLPPLTITTDEYRRRLLAHIDGNEHELLDPRHQLPAAQVRRIHHAQRMLINLAGDLFDTRVRDGRVVDGHGDLRPEHIYFTARPTIIDCLEFSAELRQLDVLDELAFLAMECEHLRAAWIGERIIHRYRETSGDEAPQVLFDFYKSYRACVRAKVVSLRAAQAEGRERRQQRAEARRYLKLAADHAARFGPPLLLVVYGLSGTGKSTLAEHLSASLGIRWLATDMIRRECENQESSHNGHASADQRYQPQQRMAVYDEMLRRADALLAEGHSLLLDGTFPTAELRRRAVAVAERHGAVPVLLHCHCSPQVAIERIRTRQTVGASISEATPDVYRQQQREFADDPPLLDVCSIDTDVDPGLAVAAAFRQLRSLLVPGPAEDGMTND